MRNITLSVCVVAFAAVTGGAAQYRPPAGFVPNSTTARAIAEAVLIPIYGRAQIDRERPLVATLNRSTWTVRGALPRGFRGGVAEVRLSKIDGRILWLWHGK
jgi:hypothetical protein